MPLKEYKTSQTIRCKPLTPEGFGPFGTCISAREQLGSSDKSSANYGTAVKLHKVSKIENLFANAPSGTEATPNWNIFRCSPPNHLLQDIDGELHYTAKVLERHPFSSQTFIPMGVDKGNENAYVVICGHKDDEAMPITDQVEAFICRGDQAVTYAPGKFPQLMHRQQKLNMSSSLTSNNRNMARPNDFTRRQSGLCGDDP